MKKRLLLAVLLTVTMATSALAGINVSVGIPELPPTVVIETAPRFIYAPGLGFHVSVGAPYDIVYIGDNYYIYNNGYYYMSSNYNGPWVGVEARRLPKGLRKHRYEEIRRYRDREFHKYERDRDHYRGRWYNPVERRGGDQRGGDHRGDDHRGGEDRR